jgi:hypothetical protein
MKSNKTNEIIIKAQGGSVKDVDMIITNIEAREHSKKKQDMI